MAETVGTIMMASTIAAGNMPPLPRVVENSGMILRLSCSQSQPGRIMGMMTKIPHSPYTTLGMAASNSTRFFNKASRPSGRPFQNGLNCRPNSFRI